jgi:hypothetical protein
VFLNRISLLFFLSFCGAIPFRGRERGFAFGFGFDFGLLARGAVLRTGCVSAFLPLGLELGGTGWEEDVSTRLRGRGGLHLWSSLLCPPHSASPPRAGWYPSSQSTPPHSASPTPVAHTEMCLASSSRRRGCTGRKGKQTRMGVDGTQAWMRVRCLWQIARMGVEVSDARGMSYAQEGLACWRSTYPNAVIQKNLITTYNASAKCPRVCSVLIRSSSEPPEIKPTYI